MTLNLQGFTVIELPPVEEELLASFDDLPLDLHCGGKQRYRRFSQYRMDFHDGHWQLSLLPHRSYIQPKKYNSFAGDTLRQYEPLKIDPSIYVGAGAEAIPLDINLAWHVNVHQWRVIVRPNIPGISVPEGPHRDGREYIMMAVFRRCQIIGGETSLLPLGGGPPFLRTTLQEGQAMLLDDTRMWHYASDIEALECEGHRDIWVVTFNRWEKKGYGPEYEQRVLVGL